MTATNPDETEAPQPTAPPSEAPSIPDDVDVPSPASDPAPIHD
jgi:hypothetical protein